MTKNLAPKPTRVAPKSTDKAPTDKAPKSTAKTPNQPTKSTNSAKPSKKDTYPVWALILALIVVVGGGILFVGAVAGWFNQSPTATLDPEYITATSTLENTDGDFLALLTPEDYQQLINDQKSFVVFIDQTGCMTAERVRGYVTQYAAENGIKPYRLMFSNLNDTPLKEQVKYYPSVAVISDGQPIAWLKTDADEDTAAYNDYTAFQTWLNQKLGK